MFHGGCAYGERIIYYVVHLLGTATDGAPGLQTATGAVHDSQVDMYWGSVESAPGVYVWTHYRSLLQIILDMGFKIKVS